MTLSNHNTATARTGVNATVSAVVLWGMAKLTGWEINADDPVFIAIIGVGLPIVHRVSTVLTEIWPPLGFILFGVRTAPTYPLPPPPPAG